MITDAFRATGDELADIYRYYHYVAFVLHRDGFCYPNPNYGSYLRTDAVRQAWQQTAALIAQGDAPSKLTGYVHIPFCACACLYCMSGSLRTRRKGDCLEPYLDSVIDEMASLAEPLANVEVLAAYLGGGTPSILTVPQIERVIGALRDHYRFTAGSRIIFEASPFTMDADKIALLERLGVHELALGVQSFDQQVLIDNRRPQKVAQSVHLIERAVRSAIPSVTVDIMVGMPHQSSASALASVEQAMALDVDGVMLNEFMPLPHTRFVREGHPYTSEQHAEKRRATQQCEALLRAGGYPMTSSGFRKKWTDEDERRVYKTQETGSLIGFGYGAYSHAWGSLKYQQIYPFDDFAGQLGAAEWLVDDSGANAREMFAALLGAKYERFCAEHPAEPRRYVGLPMSLEREMYNHAYSRLFYVDTSEFEQRFGRKFEEVFAEQLKVLSARGLVELQGDHMLLAGHDQVANRVTRALFVDDDYIRAMLEMTAEPYDPEMDYAPRIREITRSTGQAGPDDASG